MATTALPERVHVNAFVDKDIRDALEQAALRIGEAVNLRWAKVDVAGLRLRLPRSATKTNKARWIYLPDWLMQAIEATSPLEDRVPERRVFQGLHESAARQLAERAGHARPSMSLDVYSHVMPPDEAASERFLALIDA
jgi:integrase